MKTRDPLELDFFDDESSAALDRRDFLKLSGGGIAVLFFIGDPRRLLARSRRRLPGGRQYPDDFNAYLLVGADGKVTCLTGKIEMGQGVITSLAQELADELDVSIDSVEMVMGDTDRCPWDMGTFGSLTTRFFGPALRAAGAEARAVLIKLAAERLGVPARQLVTERGKVMLKSDKKRAVSYASLARGKKITKRVKSKTLLKKAAEFKIIGRPVSRRDAHEKVTGQAKFAADMRLPGMLYARILRPTAHGSERTRLDTSGAGKIPGLRVIEDGDLVAVLHQDPGQADAGLDRIKADFDVPEATVDEKSIYDHLLKSAPAGQLAAHGGNLARGAKRSKTVIERTYLNAYVAHAPIETHSALAKVDGQKATIWASSQTPFRLKDEVAKALAIPEANVHVISPFVGGGFGGKSFNQQAVEAARLSHLTGKPVQVAWSRAEEFFYDTFRPAALVKIKAGLGADKKLVLWDYGVYFAGQRGSEQFYDIPNHRTRVFGNGWRGDKDVHPFATGAWRAPANNTNTFARESHIDALARAAGIDPLDFRLKSLRDKKMLGVLKAAADKFGWKKYDGQAGRGRGIALGIDSGTYVATIVEVEVDPRSGHVQVKRVVCAQDMGLCINPQGAKLQIEGCVTMGLGYALSEQVRFSGGEILDRNFDSYEIPKFSWLPEIETIVIDARDKPPQGGGEPAIITVGGAVANAVFDAVGRQVLELPMTPERVLAALGEDPAH